MMNIKQMMKPINRVRDNAGDRPFRVSVLFATMVTVVTASLSGCSCGEDVSGRQTSGTAVSISIISPAADVTSLDDLNPTLPGVQVDILVAIKGLGGDFMLSHTLEGVSAPGVGVAASLAQGESVLRFSGYTLETGAIVLRVIHSSHKGDKCEGKTCTEASFLVQETRCVFITPADQSVITEDAYLEPSNILDLVDVDVALNCMGLAENDYVGLVVNGRPPLVAQVDTNGDVTFIRVALREGENLFVARPGTDSQGASPVGVMTQSSVTVSTDHCTVRLAPGEATVFTAADDLDRTTAGMQVELDVVSSCADGSTVTLWVEDIPTTDTQAAVLRKLYEGIPSTSSDPDGLRFTLQGVTLPESTFIAPPGNPYNVVLIARVSDDSGLQAGPSGVAFPVHYWVDSIKPTILNNNTAQPFPALGSCIGPAQDSNQDVSDGIQVDVSGRIMDNDGSEIWLRVLTSEGTRLSCPSDTQCTTPATCLGGFCRYHAEVTPLTAGAAFIVSNVPVPTGINSLLEYVAVDRAGNKSDPLTVPLEVFDALPTLTITDPIAGALGQNVDTDSDLPGLQYTLLLDVKNVSTGTTGQITGTSVPLDFVLSGGDSTASVPMTLIDGSRTLRATLSDLACGTTATSSEVTVDVSSQTIALGMTVTAADLLQEVVNDTATTGSSMIDVDILLGLGVFSRSVTVSIFPQSTSITGPGNTVIRGCGGTAVTSLQFTVAANDVGISASTTTELKDIAISPGDNCIQVIVVQGGSRNELYHTVNRRAAALTPLFTTPTSSLTWSAADDKDSNASNGFSHDVVVALSGSDTVDGTINLAVGTLFSLSQSVTSGTASVTFFGVSLPAGVHTLGVTYTDAYGLSTVGGDITVTINLPGPVISISSPSHNESLQTDGSGNVNIVLNTALTSTAVTCRIIVDNVAQGNISWNPTLTIPVALSESPTAYNIQASCDDSSASTGYSNQVSVVVDNTPPSAPLYVDEAVDSAGRIVYSSAPPIYINGLVGDVAAAAGLQHDVVVTVVGNSGEDLGQWGVTLDVTTPAGILTSYQQTVVSGTSSVPVTFAAIDFGSTDGTLLVVSRVTDRAGNISADQTATLSVDTTAPSLTQLSPNPNKTQLLRVDDQDSGLSFVDIGFSYSGLGGPVGVNCTTDPRQCFGLTVSPAPNGMTAGDFPLRQSLISSGGTVTFPLLPLEDSTSYTASVEWFDEAGNRVSLAHSFSVSNFDPALSWGVPSAAATLINNNNNTGSAGNYRRNFTFNGSGFALGTTVNLCSTQQPASGTCLGAACACEWGVSQGTGLLVSGTDPQQDNRGWVIASGTLTGTGVISSFVNLSDVPLGEGGHILHTEGKEADGTPNVASLFLPFTVDSIGPVVTAITLNNDTGVANLLGRSEGTIVNGELRTSITISVTGAEVGQSIDVQTQGGGSVLAVSGSLPTLSGTTSPLTATFDILLIEGDHILSVLVSDQAGNSADLGASVTQNVTVDITFPTVSVPVASGTAAGGALVYIGVDGTLNDVGTTTLADDTLSVLVTVAVADGSNDLSGYTLHLGCYTNANGDLPKIGTGVDHTFTVNDTSHIFSYPLLAGTCFLKAILTDTAGNVGVSSVRSYAADLYAPQLTLSLVDQGSAKVTGCGASSGNPCTIDALDPALSAGTAIFDRNASSVFCSPLLGSVPCNSAGSDLHITVTDCNSAPGIENCNTTNVSVLLEARVVGAISQAFTTLSTYSATATDVSGLSFPAGGTPGYGFAAGAIHEVRLRAVDSHGNISVTPALFLGVYNSGVGISVKRLNDAMLDSGELLANDLLWGAANNLSSAATGTFATHLQVVLDDANSEGPTHISLQLNADPVQTVTLTGGALTADFTDQVLALSQTLNSADVNSNTVTISAYCAGVASGATCGTVTYTNLRVDIAAPKWQFDRYTLCQAGVPLANNSACTSCTGSATCAANSDATGDLSTLASAQWSLVSDGNSNSTDVWDVGAAGLGVRLTGIENGQQVTLVTDQTALPLVNNQVTASGCPATGECLVLFPNLQVPTVAGTGQHVITVSVNDAAGNSATVLALRNGGTEKITALTDVTPPDAISIIACSDNSGPGCAATCGIGIAKCNRTGGTVTLSFNAVGDDGSVGNDAASSYTVFVAALGIPYGSGGSTVTYSSCDQLVRSAGAQPVTETTAVLETVIPSAPASSQTLTVSNLYPQRAYCFVVEATDDIGNRGIVATGTTAFDLIYTPLSGFQAFDPNWTTRADDAVTPLLTYAGGLEPMLTNVGDLNNDGRDDLAVVVSQGTGVQPQIEIYLSGNTATPLVADIVIKAPNKAASTFTNERFGTSIVAGDFNGDLKGDIAVSQGGWGDNGSFNAAGAIFIYYGTGDAAGLRQIANPQLPTTGGDADLPNLLPDVALFGQTFSYLGWPNLVAGQIDGVGGTDLVTNGGGLGGAAGLTEVWGFLMTATRFAVTLGGTTKVILDVAAPTANTGANPTRPDFIARVASDTSLYEEGALSLADLDHDGNKEVIYSAPSAGYTLGGGGSCSDCGEVFVLPSSAAVLGAEIAPTDISLTRIRYGAGSKFLGKHLWAVKSPRGSRTTAPMDNADWLLMGLPAGSTTEVLLLKGSATGIEVPASTSCAKVGTVLSCTTPADFPVLNRGDWADNPITRLGYSFANLGDVDKRGGNDFILGQDNDGTIAHYNIIYTYDAASDSYMRQSIMAGGSGTFGSAVTGLNNFSSAAAGLEIVLGDLADGTIHLLQ